MAKLQRSGKGRIDVWSRLLDAGGTTHTIRMTADGSNQPGEDWQRLSGTVKPEIQRPVRFMALEVYEPPTSPIGSAATLTIDSLSAVDDSGASVVVTDFADIDVWHPMATSIADDSRLSITDDGGEG